MMKLYDYYRESAELTLNGALAALVPAALLLMANFFFAHMKAVMFYCFPFFLYSIFCFQNYLFKKRRSIKAFYNFTEETKIKVSILNSRRLLLFFMPTYTPRLLLFFSDGTKAGEIARMKKSRSMPSSKGIHQIYSLKDHKENEIGKYIVFKHKSIVIDIYNGKNEFIGSYQKEKKLPLLKEKKKILDSSGKVFGTVIGASFFMKEIVTNEENGEVAVLTRGVLPIDCDGLFPDSNTPIFTFDSPFSEEAKLLELAVLIDQYFIER